MNVDAETHSPPYKTIHKNWKKYIEMEQGVYVLNGQLRVFLDRWGETV